MSYLEQIDIQEINPGWDWKNAIPPRLILYREFKAIEKTCIDIKVGEYKLEGNDGKKVAGL